MEDVNDIKEKRYLIASSKSIRRLLKQKWLIVSFALILTGLGAAITGVLFKAGIHELDNWRLFLLKKFPAWFVLPILGGAGGFLSGTIIYKFAPAASGSGVSHIMAYLRHKKVAMGIRVGLIKLISGIIAIGSGFPLGPEGPSVQMGGSVAWQMAKWLKAPNAFRRVIVAAGGGAGIAAIFSAPIGGFIYAIEELLNSARPVVLLLVVVTTFWADTWADVLQAAGINPNAGGFDISLGFQLEREYTPIVNFLPVDFVYLIALGITVGLLAELYCKYVLSMQKKYTELFKNHLTIKMTSSGVLLGGMYSLIPTEFHKLGDLQNLIVSGNADIKLAIGIFIILFFSSGLAAASGAPGGLFFPMLTLGGAIGLACGISVEALTGHVPSTYIFAGMGAFIAACSRTPITAMFLAFALTKDLLILKPILIACLTSFLIARIFSEDSIYERQIRLE
tara:strand:- start:1294 stop:2643 length:1350 start_codon:yes stop_codon:yes gene_type:complete